MPLFQFARLNRIPMIALNVERSLVARVGREGWEAAPPSEREGLSDPAPASPAYQRALARVYLMKRTIPREAAERLSSSREPNMPEPEEAALAEAMKEPEFKRFVEAQLTWDRAMAEALASANRKFSNATIVGVLGSGHVENGHGVPHQLKDLGVTALTTLIPVSVDTACKYVGTSYADAVFTLPRSEETLAPARPRLGVLLMQGDGALRINRVVSGSVAEAAGLQAGDHVVRAAGLEMRNSDDLVEIVSRQAPGTWLPLGIRRDGQEIDLIAKFPTLPRQDR
jgi:Haem-binding uptake, Tiki superfamily, ChaN/PDZ domain